MSDGWYPTAIKRPILADNFGVGRNGQTVQAIVMHIASGRLAGVFPTFNTPGIQVSAHFCIAQDGTVEQYVSVDDTAFANGLGWQAERNQWLNPRGKIVTPSWQYLIPQINPNSYTVSIEHEGWPQDKWTDAMYMANHRLLLWLAEKFNLTITPRCTLIGHNEIDPIDKPNCPGPNVEFERIAQDITVTIAARKFTWMPINTLAALYRFAQLNSLGYPQTDEFEFTSGSNTYVAQVFNLGIVFVKKGDWGNVRWVQKI